MKRILIIGATSGIATACARIWAKEGAALALIGRDQKKLQSTAADLIIRGAQSSIVYPVDLADLNQHQEALAYCFNELKEIDIILIAHGTLPQQDLCEKDRLLMLKEFHINATSTISLLTIAANLFEQQGHGTIATISSVAGDRGRSTNYIYGSAKAAVTTFCEGLRGRLFHKNIHVLTIKPGFVDTPMTQNLSLPPLLIAKPDKVAQDIIKAIEKKTNTLYTPWFWYFIMLIIKHIPAFIFKKLKI